MAKQDSAGKGAAGLAEWLPLLGSICHALASISEKEAGEKDKPRASDLPDEHRKAS